jgi:hypothetical protein
VKLLKLRAIPVAAIGSRRVRLVAANKVIIATNLARRVAAGAVHAAKLLQFGVSQAAWAAEQDVIRSFCGKKEDRDLADAAYAGIEGPYGFTRPNFAPFTKFKRMKTKQCEVHHPRSPVFAYAPRAHVRANLCD